MVLLQHNAALSLVRNRNSSSFLAHVCEQN